MIGAPVLGRAAYLAAAVAVLVARRPDAVTHPQIWAEDGTIWFADAYNRGASTLLDPHAGYLALLPRAVALLAVAAGLGHAAQLFTAVGLLLQIAPAVFILSRRFDALIPSLPARCALGLAYLLIPDAEAHANLANAQWHLAVLMLMVLVAAPPRGRPGAAGDLVVIAAGGLTAAVGIVLAPIAVVRWLVVRTRWSAVLAVVAVVTAAIQVVSVLTHPAARGTAPLGAGVRTLVRIVTDRVVVPGLVGEQNPSLFSVHWWHGLLGAAAVTAATLALALWALRRGPWELRLLLGFGGLALGLALLSPLVAPTGDQWAALLAGDTATRYFLLPTVALWGALVWAVSRLPRRARPVVGGTLAVVLVTGVALQLPYPPLVDRHPAQQAATLRSAAPGTPVDLLINPAGWHMVLVRR
ncbi:MAG TPA: hypothetical protein VH134_07540 [Candidatus Dormibacteraeota bacterium]|nr:hypothetical protein [Candidatus Dormibacteraeota bacterium]